MLENLVDSIGIIVNQTKVHLPFLLGTLGVLLVVHLVNVIMQYRLTALGIYPRSVHGFLGIFFAPFLHGSFNHLFFNAIPLFVLMDFMLLYSQQVFIMATISIFFISGILTWAFGRKAIHVGASSVITGYWGYLVFHMYQQPSITSIILGILCLYYFAGILFGVLPLRKSTSWEGHLSGLVGGIVTAWGMTIPAFYNFLSRFI